VREALFLIAGLSLIYGLPAFIWGYGVARQFGGRMRMLVLIFGAVAVELVISTVSIFAVNSVSKPGMILDGFDVLTRDALGLSLYIWANAAIVILPFAVGGVAWGYTLGTQARLRRAAAG